MFSKMHHEPVKNGLIAEIGDSWGVLCALAVYADKNGECYPTQDDIAFITGMHRTTISRHVKRLCATQYNGKPVLTKTQVRYKGNYGNNLYTLNTEIFSVFG